jgi:Glycosyltransferase family 87
LSGQGLDGRWVVVLCASLYLVMAAVLTGPFHAGRTMVLQGMGVPAMEPLFGDTLCVARWCDAYGMGEDPRSSDFSDPSGKIMTMNYPVYFLSLHHIGLSARTVPAAGWILCVLFLGSTLLLAGRCTLKEGFLWSAAVCSPVIVMIVERGNLDITIFALLVLALLARRRPLLSGFAILSATALKFYPIAGFLSLITRKNGRWILFCSFALGGCVAIALGMSTVGHLPTSLGLSSCCFGSKLVPLIMSDRGIRIPASLPLFFQMGSLVLLAVSIWIGRGFSPDGKQAIGDDRSHAAFWIGVPVYLLVFLSGDQADYKMVMLLFAFPFVLSWRRNNASNEWIASVWIILFFIYAYWLFFSDEGSLRNQLLRQVIAWALFLMTGLVAGLVMPSPGKWLRMLRGTAS